MMRLLVACGAACLVLLARAAPAAAIDIAPDAQRVAVWPALRIVVAADPRLAPEQAAALAAGHEAIGVNSPTRILGRGRLPYWALFSLSNPEASELSRLLALESTTQADTRLYQRLDTGAWREIGSLAAAAEGRIGGGTTHPVWPLQLKSRQTAELLLRVEGPSVVRFPVFVYQAGRFAEHERQLHVVAGLALGACLFIGIYIGTLRRFLDDASIPLCISMLIADMVGALWLSGFLAELFPALPEATLSAIGCAAYATLFGCGSLHIRLYLNCAAWAPRIDRFLRLFGWLWLASAPWLALAFPIGSRIALNWGGAATGLIALLVSVLAARRKVAFSGFIAAAWLAYLISGASILVARLGDVIPVGLTSSVLILVQATVVAILFGLAMSQRLIRQREELVAAHQEARMQREQATVRMRERSLLFAATNHDLRQPLLGVGLFADLLKSAATPAERQEHALKLSLALKEVDELLVGIQQLATVHEAAHRPPFETVELDALLAPIIEEYRGRSEYKRITIRHVPSRLSITTHVPYFQRIVRNVLSNAVRYTEQGDRILVGCRRGGGLRLVIADSGRGMSGEQTRRAFDAFQRFDAEMSIPDGFGLGLFSTKSLANALGLAVSLHSHEGRGTEFSISMAAAGPCQVLDAAAA